MIVKNLMQKIESKKYEEILLKNIKLEHMKSTKYHYHVLMMKGLF